LTERTPASITPRPTLVAVLAVVFLIVVGISVCAMLPLTVGSALVLAYVWMAWPGVMIARTLYGSQRGEWLPALTMGPVWGFAATSLVLLALWIAGVRHTFVLALAPLGALALLVPCRWLRGALRPPAFDRRDAAAVLLALLIVPAVVARPYARVGEMRPEGKAYRAYFIADFEWAMAVAEEVSKGDVPPKNPFLAGDHLHYYWLASLASAIEHRAAGHVALEPLLLTNALLLDLGFVAFFYGFVRHFVRSPAATVIACAFAIFCTSFEGAQQMFVFWQRDVPFAGLRDLNIDGISNWKFGSLKVDGLQRLLLYQPHHATAWALSLSALLVLQQATDASRVAINLLAGLLLATGLLVSSFIALMVGTGVAVYQGLRLVLRRQWRAMALGALAAGAPVGLAVVISNVLEYVDRSAGPIVSIGHLNPVAATNTLTGIVLSFGPILIIALVGAWLAARRRAVAFSAIFVLVAVGFWFYFFVDVVDHQHAYVGWRSGHLLFIAMAPLVALVWQEGWSAGGALRVATAAGIGVLSLAALPTTAIDLYNAQDTANQHQGPGFRWTEILSPGEVEALDWLKANTADSALVQVDPVRPSGTWAYMPGFGARRMAAGMPISMIPLKKYRDASDRMRKVFQANDAAVIHQQAVGFGIDYLYIGPAERAAYPTIARLLDAAPQWFQPVFRNDAVTIYGVVPSTR
jgi:hypothetical protein